MDVIVIPPQTRKCIIQLIVFLAVLYLFFRYIYPQYIYPRLFKEGFSGDDLPFNEPIDENTRFQLDQHDIDIPPDYYDPDTGSLIAGPGFVSRFSVDRPWEEGWKEGKIRTDYFLDDGGDLNLGLQHNFCHKSCCSEQWPTPFKQKYDPYLCKLKKEFVPSNYTCNNGWQDSGCVCLTKQQHGHLVNRGKNAGDCKNCV